MSHLVAYWIKVQPLGELLGTAVDAGERLSETLWHPLRPPVWVTPLQVEAQSRSLTEEWRRVREGGAQDEWSTTEIDKVVGLYAHAALRQEGVVSFLEAPYDEDRARMTVLPKVIRPSA